MLISTVYRDSARAHRVLAGLAVVITLSLAGCQTPGGSPDKGRKPGRGKQPLVRQVVCLFDQRPWINADLGGDRDPEGLRYRVFLDTDAGKGVLLDGTFHVEMYRIKREAGKETARELVSDWHYPTSHFGTVSAKILGEGYMLQLRWAKKDIPGSEVEITTSFESPDGRSVRAATTRKRVPKYAS